MIKKYIRGNVDPVECEGIWEYLVIEHESCLSD